MEKTGNCRGYRQSLFYRPFRIGFGIIGIGFLLALSEDFGSVHLGYKFEAAFYEFTRHIFYLFFADNLLLPKVLFFLQEKLHLER
jgi:hypothetical protein